MDAYFFRQVCLYFSKKLIRTAYKLVENKDGNQIPAENKFKNYSIEENDKIVTIGLIQTSVSENIAENMKKTAEKIEEAAKKGAQIVCLQELYRTRYFPQEENKDVTALAEVDSWRIHKPIFRSWQKNTK